MIPEVFVFGSNLTGRHGAGAALYARKHHGAEYGVGQGPTGNAYAIPTKDENLKPLPLARIRTYIQIFIMYAINSPATYFNITRIGCGLAGYKDEEIGPMFEEAPCNCKLPKEWLQYRA